MLVDATKMEFGHRCCRFSHCGETVCAKRREHVHTMITDADRGESANELLRGNIYVR